MGRRKTGIIFLILSGLLFGTSPLICYTATFMGSNYDTFLVMRSGISIFVLTGVLIVLKVPFKVKPEYLRDGIIAAFIHSFVALMLTLSYGYIGGGMATTLHFVYPICVMVISCLVFRAKVNWIKISALVFCVVGVALVSSGGEGGSITGVLLAAGSGVVYSIYIVYLERSKVSGLHPMQLCVLLNIFMCLVAFSYGKICGTFDLSKCSLATYAFSFVPVLVISMGGHPLFQKGVYYTDGTTSALLSTTEPITAMILGWLCMSEEMTVFKFFGGACIIAGVILVVLGEYTAAKSEKQETKPANA